MNLLINKFKIFVIFLLEKSKKKSFFLATLKNNLIHFAMSIIFILMILHIDHTIVVSKQSFLIT